MKLPKWHKSTFKKSHLNSEPIPTKTKGNANKNKQAPTSLNLCRWYSGQSGRQGGGAAGGAGDAGGGGAGAAPPTMRVHACTVQGDSTHFKLDKPERWNVYISLISFYCSQGERERAPLTMNVYAVLWFRFSRFNFLSRQVLATK